MAIAMLSGMAKASQKKAIKVSGNGMYLITPNRGRLLRSVTVEVEAPIADYDTGFEAGKQAEYDAFGMPISKMETERIISTGFRVTVGTKQISNPNIICTLKQLIQAFGVLDFTIPILRTPLILLRCLIIMA